MNIGIISTIGNLYNWAGSEEMWRGVAIAAIGTGAGVTVSMADRISTSRQVKDLQEKGVRILPRKELNGMTRRLATRAMFSRFSKIFSQKHDVILVSMGGIADCRWIPDLLEEFTRTQIPYVVVVQANAEGLLQEEEGRVLLRRFYARAASVLFVSEHNRELAERQLGLDLAHAVLMPNPLRSEVHEPVSWPDEAPFRLAEVARLELADKQQDHLLKALSGKAWQDRNWQLTFYGSGPDEGHIRRLIDFYELQDKVKIGGFVSDFRDIWRDNHLHILPSRREGMPLSLIESMACGRPALVTRAGGSAELVEEGISGWICPGMHPEVLAETLEHAWEARDRWQALGLAARDKILTVSEPDWEGRILEILKEASRKGGQV
ncbi:glycosyltransferase [Haloferula chungangensis]|uniref:Glycosyltransferase n=1 Tax=Haloferula chungangensis TaxID=1048331 RepID=A0ABW2LAC3_9BACT